MYKKNKFENSKNLMTAMEVQTFSTILIKFKSNWIQTEFQQTSFKFHIKLQNQQNWSKSKILFQC